MIEITFDSSDGFVYDPGIEFVDSSIRLITPDNGRQAVYFAVALSSPVTAAEADWTSLYNIPVGIWEKEPTLDEVRNYDYEYNLSTIWELLKDKEGDFYIGLVLGGTISETMPTAPFDPVGYWNFDNGLLSESRMQGIDGINYGAVSVDTNRSQGFSFENGSYISFGNPEDLRIRYDLSLVMWIYPRSFSNRCSILHKAYGGEMSITLETDGTLNFYYGIAGSDNTPYQGFNSSSPIILNQYNHIAVVRNITDMTLHWFLDTREVSQTPAVYDYAAESSNNLTIGTGYAGNFDGIIDELVIYDKILDSNDLSLIRSNKYIGEVYINVGQMIVSDIRIMLENVWEPGNVINEFTYAYKGSDIRDTLLRLNRITEATEDFSNITFSADRELLPYIIANPSPDYLDVIIGLPKTRENLFVYVNDSFDSDWVSKGLIGIAMDSKSINGVNCTNVKQLESSWELYNNSKIYGNVSADIDYITFYTLIRKTSLDENDKAVFNIEIGDLKFSLLIDDTNEFIDIRDELKRKPNFPWTTNYIPLKILLSPTNTKIYLFDQVMYKGDTNTHYGTVSMSVLADCECQLKSFYFGPLSNGEAELITPTNKLVAAGTINCTGEMYLAGNQKMESIGDLYILSDNIYLNKELYAKTPGMFLDDPVLFGIKDTVSGDEHLYYGSKSTYEIYRYDGEYWSLYLEARLFSIWRSLHTEGLIVQLPDESSMKIHLFKRENNKLVFNKYISFTGLPDSDFQFEPILDRRISQKTCPWIWATDQSLSGPK